MITTLATVTGYLVLSIAGAMALLCVITGNKYNSSAVLWHFIAWVQFYQWISLINSESSTDFLAFFSQYFSVIKIQQVITFNYSSIPPTRFSALGIQYSYFINNTEKPLTITAASFLVFLMYYFCYCKCAQSIRNIVCDNLILRAIIMCFHELCLFGFLQISKFEISSWYGIMNSVLAVAVICCEVVALIYIPINLHFRLNEKNPEELLKIKTLIDGFKTDQVKTRFYYLFFLFQRFLSAGSYSFLISYPGLQCLSISIPIGVNCIFYIVLYIFIAWPFEKREDNVLAFILEFFSLVFVIFTTLFSSGVFDSVENYLFWGIISMMWLGMGLCFLKFLATFCYHNDSASKVSPETDVYESRENDDKRNLSQVENTLEGNPQNTKKRLSVNTSEVVISDNKLDDDQPKVNKSNIQPQKVRNSASPEPQHPSLLIDNNIKNFENGKVANPTQSDNYLIEDSNYGRGIKFYNPLLNKYLNKAKKIIK